MVQIGMGVAIGGPGGPTTRYENLKILCKLEIGKYDYNTHI